MCLRWDILQLRSRLRLTSAWQAGQAVQKLMPQGACESGSLVRFIELCGVLAK
jgi:hypothetical protein